MSEFEENIENAIEEQAPDVAVASSSSSVSASPLIRADAALSVLYCPFCSFPPEYCSYGVYFMEKCVPWILENCPDALDEELLSQMINDVTVGEDGEEGTGKKKSKRGGIGIKKKAPAAPDCKVIIARIQRQKRKYVTAVAGLETVPNLKLKDAVKALGKKFASGASVTETASGAKEVVIQGDVSLELPEFFAVEFNVPVEAIFMLEDGNLRPCA
jgi:density-regulated protein DRP1